MEVEERTSGPRVIELSAPVSQEPRLALTPEPEETQTIASHRREYRSRLWRWVTQLTTLYAHILPIVAEILFLKPNIENLLSHRNWYILPIKINPIRFPLAVFLPPSVYPYPLDDSATNASFALSFDPMSLNCNGFDGSSRSQRIWYLTDSRSHEPSEPAKIAPIVFCGIRWLSLIIRSLLYLSGLLSTPSWAHLGGYLFAYASSVIFSISLIGTQIRDCIDWWAFGSSGLQLFNWQIAYWYLNTAGIALLGGFALLLFLSVKCSHRAGHVHGWGLWMASVCGDALSFITLVFFTGSALLGSALVLALGIYKLWILSIWLTIAFLCFDTFARRRWARYAGLLRDDVDPRREGHYRSARPDGDLSPMVLGKIPSISEDGSYKKFTHIANTYLFSPVNEEGISSSSSFSSLRGVTALSSPGSSESLVCAPDRDVTIASQIATARRRSGQNRVDENVSVLAVSREVSGISLVSNTLSKVTLAKELSYVVDVAGGATSLCLVCMDNLCDCVLQPCGHGVICRPCMKLIIDQEQARLQRPIRRDRRPSDALPGEIHCPLCRSIVKEIYQIQKYPQNPTADLAGHTPKEPRHQPRSTTFSDVLINQNVVNTQRIWTASNFSSSLPASTSPSVEEIASLSGGPHAVGEVGRREELPLEEEMNSGGANE